MLPDHDSGPVHPTPPSEEPDLAGRTLSHYRIIEKIGQGGMATVYRAEDLKLKRLVALKVMAPSWTEEASARARFLREAQAAAALDHPNICTVYEIDQANSHDFITMSYLEGQTLADRIGAGPLSIPDAVDIALQAARGLQAAHEEGVVHRDIKPANLMILESGAVKIMDSGVAYVREAQPLTESGLTMGTAAYMSPEQIESAKVDGRSDVWSLGVVLYQMLSGRLPFQRGSTREVLAAIMAAKPPPLSEIRSGMPPALTAVVDKALGKDPSRRYQSSELAADLQELDDQLRTGERTAGDLPADHRREAARFRWRAILAAAAAAALVLAFANFGGRESTPESETPQPVPFTAYLGYEDDPVLSPDATRVAYVWDGGSESGEGDIYVQLISSQSRLRLTATAEREGSPAWSPGGDQIAFLRYGDVVTQVIVIPALGGAETKIGEVAGGDNLTWSPDGESLALQGYTASRDYGIFTISLADRSIRPLTRPGSGENDCCPRFDPSGKRMVFRRNSREEGLRAVVLPLDGGEPQEFATNSDWHTWTADGSELIFSGPSPTERGRLWRLDLADGSIDPLPFGTNGAKADIRGSRLVYTSYNVNTNIWKIDLAAFRAPSASAGSANAGAATGSQPAAADSGVRHSSLRAESRTARISRPMGSGSCLPRIARGRPRFGPATKMAAT